MRIQVDVGHGVSGKKSFLGSQLAHDHCRIGKYAKPFT